MASHRQHQPDGDRLSFGSMCSETRRRRGSTSQMCLQKILTVITSKRPTIAAVSSPPSNKSTAENDATDKNQRLNSSSSTGFEGGAVTARDGGGFQPNFKDDGGNRLETEKNEANEICPSSNIEIGEAEESLSLLFKAAKLILGEFKDGADADCRKPGVSPHPDPKTHESAAETGANERSLRRQSSCWTAAEESGREITKTTSSATVRSKRGRSRVLPSKYRDSVLEPLTRLCSHRSSVPTAKRRRR